MLNKYDLKYKEYIKLVKRLNFVRDEISKIPLVELEKPYQRGWEVYYDLRQDVKNRQDGPELMEALRLQYDPGYTRSAKFVRKVRSGKILPYTMYDYGGELPWRNYINHDKYDRFIPSVKKFFYYDRYDTLYKHRGASYRLDFPSHYLIIKVKPYMITHTRITGGELEQEEAYLRYTLYWSGKYNEFCTDYGASYPRSKMRTQARDTIRKFMNGDIDDIIISNKVPLEYEY